MHELTELSHRLGRETGRNSPSKDESDYNPRAQNASTTLVALWCRVYLTLLKLQTGRHIDQASSRASLAGYLRSRPIKTDATSICSLVLRVRLSNQCS